MTTIPGVSSYFRFLRLVGLGMGEEGGEGFVMGEEEGGKDMVIGG